MQESQPDIVTTCLLTTSVWKDGTLVKEEPNVARLEKNILPQIYRAHIDLQLYRTTHIDLLDLLIWDKLWRINMGLTYVIPDIIKSYLSWRKIQKCFKSTSRTAFKDSNSLDPFVLFTLLATVSYTIFWLSAPITIIAIHWSVSPTPTLVLDKLLFFADFRYI